MKDIKTATEEWIKSFNSYPTSFIEKVYYTQSSIDDIYEVTPITAGGRVWSNSQQNICDVVEVNREIGNALIELEDGSRCITSLDDISLEPYDYFPAWGTLWSFGDSADEWWISKEENRVKMAEEGFRLYDTEDLGIIFGIDGYNYNFFEVHWIPLYKARGLQWHSDKLDLDQLLMKHFGTDNSNGYSALITILYDLQEVGISKDNIHDIIEYLDIERGWKE